MHSAYTQRESTEKELQKKPNSSNSVHISSYWPYVVVGFDGYFGCVCALCPIGLCPERNDGSLSQILLNGTVIVREHTHICIMLHTLTNHTVHQARQSKNIWNIEEVSIVSPIHMDIALKNQMAFVIWAGIPDQNHTHKLIIKDIKVQHNHKQNGLNQGPSTK